MRRLLNLLALASLLLAAAAGAMWADSHATWRTACVRTGDSFWLLNSRAGTIAVDRVDAWPDAPASYCRALKLSLPVRVSPAYFIGLTEPLRKVREGGGFTFERGTAPVIINCREGGGSSDAGPVMTLTDVMEFSLTPLAPYWSVGVPWWSLVALFLLLPAARGLTLVARRVRRRRRRSHGFCADCGYDVRASPDRCPECGAATVADGGRGFTGGGDPGGSARR